MIVPDRPDEERRRRRGGTGGIAIALMAIVIGGLTLVSLTSPDPEAVAPTTSAPASTTTTIPELRPLIDLENFAVDQLTRGSQLDWNPTLSVVEGYPIGLLSHEDMLYVFSTEVPNFSSFETGGLRGWRSIDGVTWEPLGQVIGQTHNVTSVSSTEQGLILVEQPEDGGGFAVWRSDDGVSWETQRVEVEGLNEMTTVYPQAVGGTDEVLLVAGNVYVDTYAFFEEKLGEFARYGWEPRVIADEVRITLYGPLGPLAELSAEEVGLSEEEQQMIIEANSIPDQAEATVWVNSGGPDWQQTVIPDAQWIDRFATTPHGEVIAHGWGATGASSWTSGDGSSWDETPGPVHHYLDVRWGDRLVAPSTTDGLSVSVSADGEDWENIGPGEHFPNRISWWMGGIGAGPGGLALIVEGWDDRVQFEEPTVAVEPATITGPEGTLTIDFEANEYRLETEAGERTWSGMSMTRTGIGVNLDAGTVEFFDPESSAFLAAFPLADLMEAQEQVTYTGAREDDFLGYNALAFTSDGEEWTIQSLDELGSGEMVHSLAVTDTHVVVTAMNAAGFYDPDSPPGFHVWTAEIP
jgi:hypothetical protein